MKDYPLVSIITVNYNQFEFTVAMIESLSQLTYPNVEIIVVDNASTEDVLWDSIKSASVEIIYAERNLGFAGGNNLGIKKAKGKYLLFLNNDTTVVPDLLEPLVQFCENNSNVGAVGPQIVYADHPSRIQFSGSRLNRYTSQIKWMNLDLAVENHKDIVELSDLVHGAAMLVPTKVIKEVGMMSEEFFLLYEEFDWCERMKEAGYSLFYIGASKVFHKVSMTMKNSPIKSYYMTRNRILFIQRNFTGLQRYCSLLFVLLIGVPKSLFQLGLKREWKLIRVTLKGVFSHLKRKPVKEYPKKEFIQALK
ncbi:MAG: glycosyltransferase family 2 protein [Aureispira sp.]|nr:glycosyltransferase family 2 protein [Aureispira sp.]